MQTISHGSVSVRVYPTPSRGRDGWTVCHYIGQRRIRKWFALEADAVAYGESEAQKLSSGQMTIAGERLHNLKRLESLDARARRVGASLEGLVEKAESSGAARAKAVGELVDEFLAIKAKVVHPRWEKGLRFMLGAFRNAFRVPVHSIGPAELQAWLDGLKRMDGEPISARWRAHHRAAVASLFAFARKRQHVARDWDPLQSVEVPDFGPGKIQPYTPEELRTILASIRARRPAFVPFIAIQAFCGIRTAEMARLKADDIRSGFVVLSSEITKTKRQRLVPIQPALRRWLKKFPPAEAIAPCTPATITGRLCEVIKDSGVQTRHNGLRDGYVTYRMAVLGDAAKVSEEAGNSPSMVARSYREIRLPDGRVVTPKLAREWFDIGP